MGVIRTYDTGFNAVYACTQCVCAMESHFQFVLTNIDPVNTNQKRDYSKQGLGGGWCHPQHNSLSCTSHTQHYTHPSAFQNPSMHQLKKTQGGIVGKMPQDVGMVWKYCGVIPTYFGWFLRVLSLRVLVFIQKKFFVTLWILSWYVSRSTGVTEI